MAVEQMRRHTLDQGLGQAMVLLLQSPAHRAASLADLESLLIPPLMLDQARITQSNGGPVALTLWAFPDKKLEERLKTTQVDKLEPGEWRPGAIPKALAVFAAQRAGFEAAAKGASAKEAQAAALAWAKAKTTDRLAPVPADLPAFIIDFVMPVGTAEQKAQVMASVLAGPLKGRKVYVTRFNEAGAREAHVLQEAA